MQLLVNIVKNTRKWLSEPLKFRRTASKALNMADRAAVDDNSEDPPNKKACIREGNEESETVTKKRIKTKKVAFLLSYFGANYYGMQKNDGFRTIQEELLQAVHKANLISDKELNEPGLIHFQITARTDKGVSAVKQVVALKIAENYSREAINQHLPEDIKVLSIRKVTKGFYCSKDCNARTYSYTLPTYALAPEFHKEYPRDFRIDEKTLQKVNEILLSFVGTRNFHNFTTKKTHSDPSAKRYMMSFKAGEPFVDGEEFVTLTVKGQSFMLHQIRKMVGYVITTIKKIAPPELESDVWTEKKIGVPTAPGLGLILENIHFDWYNRKFANDGIHESLSWEECDEEAALFRKKILSNIIKKEIEERSMFDWIQFTHERFNRDRILSDKQNDVDEFEKEDSVSNT